MRSERVGNVSAASRSFFFEMMEALSPRRSIAAPWHLQCLMFLKSLMYPLLNWNLHSIKHCINLESTASWVSRLI
jgi:hypothetical protein